MGAPNEIQVGRYNRFVQKLLSMKGSRTTYLASPELDFVLSLFHGAENRYLEGWDLFGFDLVLPAPGVGNGATHTLRNPVNSNVIAVVVRSKVWEATVSNSIITLFRPGTAGANAGDENTVDAVQAMDGRGRSSSTLVLSHNTAAQVVRTGGIQIALDRISGSSLIDLLRPGDEIPLTPGSLITISAGTANETLLHMIWWRERFLEESERA